MELFRRKPAKPIQLEAPKTARICRFNNYCRTRSFEHALAEGFMGTHYEAVMDHDKTWTIFRIEETPSPKNGEKEVTQTILNKNVDFETVLEKLYMFETGAEELNYVFSNTKEDLGLDHFHVLAHAEELAFNTSGKVVETRNGRIVTEGKFSVRERNSVLEDSKKSTPEKLLKRQPLSDVFARYADVHPPINIESIFETLAAHKEAISFYDNLLSTLTNEYASDERRSLVNIINMKIKVKCEKEYKWEYRPALLDGKKISMSTISIDEGNYGRLNILPYIVEKKSKEKNIVVPQEVYAMMNQLAFFHHYLIAKIVFQNASVTNRDVFDLAKSNLFKAHTALPKDEKPEWDVVENSIASKTEEKYPEVLDTLIDTLREIKGAYEQRFNDYLNKAGNRAPVAPQPTPSVR